MTQSPSQAYVRCFWTGQLQLMNGQYLALHCTHISNRQVEVEVDTSVQGSQRVKLELNAYHKGEHRLIKAICFVGLDVLNEHDKHYLKLQFERISPNDTHFIEHFVEDHT